MSVATQFLWLIPMLPLLAAAVTALLRRRHRRTAATLAISSMALALLLSLVAFGLTLKDTAAGLASRQVFSFPWLQLGQTWLKLGWVLDPLTAVMLVMVCLVGLLIFIYSAGYMAHDQNFTRFFCFLSLFASAMLGLVIANSLLLLFICWEIVGLTSYLLIGFWYHKPSAAAAARKAFITTRIGDLALLLGMVWLYAETGTLLFYEGGNGCLEQPALMNLITRGAWLGVSAATGIGLLVFCGVIGKSGQVPLHVWLPDAMEGPTPVSALIHAATMVAAGVFLVARTYPLMNAPTLLGGVPVALQVVTWVGVITAVFAASIAVAQTDIKRILAYSTVSQLGFMMLGLGTGGVAVGMFHLVTHAFFKALLFLGAGSVIHACHDEQDIRRLGGLRKFMPVTFATYAIGMMALSGVPLFFSGFWSKDEILHAAHRWPSSQWPFFLGLAGALLTAFYMTRQVFYVFFGEHRLPAPGAGVHSSSQEPSPRPHESPRVMIVPLSVLAFFSIALGFLGTPAWPWFQAFIAGKRAHFSLNELSGHGVPLLILVSTSVVFLGIFLAWLLYGREQKTARSADRIDPASPFAPDPLEKLFPNAFALLRKKYFIDEVYDWAIVRFAYWWARACDSFDRWVIGGVVQVVAYVVIGFSWLNRLCDQYLVDGAFDGGCNTLGSGGSLLSRMQNGRVQRYLRLLGFGAVLLVLLLLWGCRAL